MNNLQQSAIFVFERTISVASSICTEDKFPLASAYNLTGTSSRSSVSEDVKNKALFNYTRRSNTISEYETRRIRELERENQELRNRITELQRCSTASIKTRAFSDGDTTVRIKPGKNPIFKVTFEDGIYTATWGKRILGYSSLRDGLLEEVNQTIVFLWNEYAVAEPDTMTASARRLRRQLLEVFEEV